MAALFCLVENWDDFPMNVGKLVFNINFKEILSNINGKILYFNAITQLLLIDFMVGYLLSFVKSYVPKIMLWTPHLSIVRDGHPI